MPVGNRALRRPRRQQEKIIPSGAAGGRRLDRIAETMEDQAETSARAAASPEGRPPHQRVVLFSYGFRPFFLLAGLWAIVPMVTLLWALGVQSWPVDTIPLFRWHAHEMIFGFVSAAIAGFLLTAVPNWTGQQAVSGPRLMALVAVWGAERIVVSPFVDLPAALALPLEVAFLPTLAFALAVPLFQAKKMANALFLLFLSLLFAADLLFHVQLHGLIGNLRFDSLRLALNVVLLMMVMIGGRIIPAFTENALHQLGRPVQTTAPSWLNAAAIGTVALIVVTDLFAQDSLFSGLLAALAALLLFGRLAHWQGHRTLDIPLLWVLHLGYGWVVVALALKALWLLTAIYWAVNWMHALNTGAFGTMILAVMTRAALGHTGRVLEASKAIAIAYLLVSVAAAMRVWGPVALPAYFWHTIYVAGGLWVAGFAIYLAVYCPVLLGPRVDEKPG